MRENIFVSMTSVVYRGAFQPVEAVKEGYVPSLITLLDFLYPEEDIPNDVLDMLYVKAIYWEYDRTGNPVRRYLAQVYTEQLDHPIGPKISKILNMQRAES